MAQFPFFNSLFNKPEQTNMVETPFRKALKPSPWRGLNHDPQPQQPTFQESYPTPMTSEYEKFLAQGAPKEQDYERSNWAKIAAALSAGAMGFAGDSNAAEKSLNALRMPYERAVNDYKMEGARLQEGAGLESARAKQMREAQQAMQEYGFKLADESRKDQTLANTLRLGDNTIRLGDNTIANTGAENIRDERSGNMYRIKPNTGESMELGNFSIPYGEKRENQNTDWQTRDAQNYAQSVNLARLNSGLVRGNMIAGKEFDLNNPTTNYMDPSQLENAQAMAERDLSIDPRFTALFTTNQDGSKSLTIPEENTDRWFWQSGNEGDVAKIKKLYADYLLEREALTRKYTSTPQNPFIKIGK